MPGGQRSCRADERCGAGGLQTTGCRDELSYSPPGRLVDFDWLARIRRYPVEDYRKLLLRARLRLPAARAREPHAEEQHRSSPDPTRRQMEPTSLPSPDGRAAF